MLDWFSRYVVRWGLDQMLEMAFVLASIAQARRHATPDIWHIDQGRHVTNPQVTQALGAAGIRMRMDGQGRARDNTFTERFWRSLKYEAVYLADYSSPRAAYKGIERYITFSNTERPHQALGYRRPAEVYLV